MLPHLMGNARIVMTERRAVSIPAHFAAEGPNCKYKRLFWHFPPEEKSQSFKESCTKLTIAHQRLRGTLTSRLFRRVADSLLQSIFFSSVILLFLNSFNRIAYISAVTIGGGVTGILALDIVEPVM